TLGRSTIAVAEPSRFLPTTLAEAISRSSVAVTQPSRAVRTGLTERLSVAAATPFRLSRLFSTSAAFDAALPLSDIIGVDYLPASGPLPEAMFTRLAGRPDGTGWTLPVMNFDPLDLQIEMVPIRTSQVEEALARERPRGVIDLVHNQGDRIRVLVAVPDEDYRRDLMDLPETDAVLNDIVHERSQEARATWQTWAELYDEIFADLDTGAIDEVDAATDEAIATFSAIRVPRPPAGVFPELDALAGDAARAASKALGVLSSVAPPLSGDDFFDALVSRRQTQADVAGEDLPRPYAQFSEAGPPRPADLDPDPVTALPADARGLYRRRLDLLRQIELLEEELDANDRLVADFDVFIRAQRQQIDSITVSFTGLAGGVPGDGSGLQLAKWTPFTSIAAIVASEN
ncbi:MAG: hypothetical protein AAF334_10720, partial [Pseudomonadota bacterium]